MCSIKKELFKPREKLNPFQHGDICVLHSLCNSQILQAMRERTVDNYHTHNILSFSLKSGFTLPTAGA